MIILIDNDLLIRKSWEMAAKAAGLTIHTFSNVNDFIKDCFEVERSIKIFIDYELDDGLFGTEEAQKLIELGFTDITLATGRSADEITLPSSFKGIIGKRPPF